MFSPREASAIEDLIGIVHELLGMVQADAEVHDERWNEAERISDDLDDIECVLRESLPVRGE